MIHSNMTPNTDDSELNMYIPLKLDHIVHHQACMMIRTIKYCTSAIFSLPVPGSGFQPLILGLNQRVLPLCYLAHTYLLFWPQIIYYWIFYPILIIQN
jgi:hypothetical protein